MGRRTGGSASGSGLRTVSGQDAAAREVQIAVDTVLDTGSLSRDSLLFVVPFVLRTIRRELP